MTRARLIVVLCILTCGALVTGAQGGPATSTITQQELIQRMDAKADVLVLDVRTPQEFHAGHIPGAMNIPHTTLSTRLNDVQSYQGKEVVVHCEMGGRAGIAEQVLRGAGFTNVRHLDGDMAAWRMKSLPIETPPHEQ